MANANITAERLRELLSYDPETGLFKNLTKRSNSTKIGEFVAPRADGYFRIILVGTRYYAHRLAWLYVHGTWPVYTIDHIDGNPSNNAIANLRDIPHGANMQNRRRPDKDSKTGVLGVTYVRKGKWQAQIGLNGRNIQLGQYPTAEAAHAAYLDAKRALHPGCTI